MTKIKHYVIARTMLACISWGLGQAGITLAAEDKGKLQEQKIGENYVITDKYVHEWIKFPTLSGKAVNTDETVLITPRPGEPLVVFFLASWCLPCQGLVGKVQELDAKFAPLGVKFVYAFSHDTAKDAHGFWTAHDMKGQAIIVDRKTLDAFHQPELPTIYVADRHAWLISRTIKTKPQDLAALEGFLKLHTSL